MESPSSINSRSISPDYFLSDAAEEEQTPQAGHMNTHTITEIDHEISEPHSFSPLGIHGDRILSETMPLSEGPRHDTTPGLQAETPSRSDQFVKQLAKNTKSSFTPTIKRNIASSNLLAIAEQEASAQDLSKS